MSNARKLAALFGAAGNIDPTFGAAPAGAVLPFAGSTAPGGWLLCYGQAISRTTYAALFAALGTTYGTGDGSTTFGLPDLRGRIPGGKDDMGGTAANRLTAAGLGVGISGATLGAAGGAETHALTIAQMPAHSHTISGATASSGTGSNDLRSSGSPAGATPTTASQGSGQAHPNAQPTLVLNYIIKT